MLRFGLFAFDFRKLRKRELRGNPGINFVCLNKNFRYYRFEVKMSEKSTRQPSTKGNFMNPIHTTRQDETLFLGSDSSDRISCSKELLMLAGRTSIVGAMVFLMGLTVEVSASILYWQRFVSFSNPGKFEIPAFTRLCYRVAPVLPAIPALAGIGLFTLDLSVHAYNKIKNLVFPRSDE